MKIPWLIGALAGLLHIMFIFALAALIFADRQSPTSGEGWLYAAWLDLPAYYLSFPFLNLVPPDWESFRFPLVWFSVMGTIQWLIIGWIVGRIIVAVQKSLREPPKIQN